MLQFISAFVATGYIFSVAFIAFLTVFAFDKPVLRELFASSLRRYIGFAEVLCSGVAESSLHLIVIKLIYIQLVRLFGGFNYTLAWISYYVDIANMIALVVLFYEMLKERTLADEAIQFFDKSSQPMNSMICFDDIKKLVNIFWTPSQIKIHPSITYATNEEIREALDSSNQDFDQPRKMMLDVITKDNKSGNSSSLRPVIVHIHGGAWRMGSKDIFYPHEKLLIEHHNWVAVNIGYRLAPKNAYPTHLIDVKRALRWIKLNIASFGGDPNFIVLSGDSAGGHLATITSMTTNDPKYQPGFEDIDTSVRGVVSLSGVLDLVNDSRHALFFCKKVANLNKVDLEFLNDHSPLALVQRAKENNTLLPFLLIAGERDALVESKMSKSFKIAYDQAVGNDSKKCTLLLLPAGHHVSYVGWSPRCLYQARVIESWCQQLYLKNI